MTFDCAAWLVDTSDEILDKEMRRGEQSISDRENAIYCFWYVSNAFRNDGNLSAVEDSYPTAVEELTEFANSNELSFLKEFLAWIQKPDTESHINSKFEAACLELMQCQ